MSLAAALATAVGAGLAGAARAEEPWVAAGWFAERWQSAEGLPVDGVSALAQTPDGYLWIATRDGLARFDGLRFRIATSATESALPSSRFTALAVAGDGRLFAATERHHVVSHRDGQFTQHAVGAELSGPAMSISLAGGEVFVGTARGLSGYEAPRLVPIAPGRWSSPVLSVARGPDGALWVGTQGDGVVRVASGRVEAALSLPGHHVHALAFGPDGALWVGTHLGLLRYRDGAIEPVRTPGPWEPAAVYSLAFDDRGRLVAGTSQGLWRVGPGGVEFLGAGDPGSVLGRPLQVGPGEVYARTARRVLADDLPIFEHPAGVTDHLLDSEGGLWIGTSRGLFRLRRQVLAPVQASGPPYNAYGVAEARDGDLWVAAQDEGVVRLRSGRRVPAVPDLEHAWSVTEAPDGAMWVAAFGLYRVEGTVAVPMGVADGLEKVQVRAVFFDRRGTQWVGSDVGLFRRTGDRYERVSAAPGFPQVPYRVIYEDRAGRLWFGTNGAGLVQLARGVARTLGTREGLPSDFVRGIAEDEAGALWLATEDRGLVRLVLRGEGFEARAIRRTDGLFDDGVHQVVDDGRGRFWMSSNRGLFHVRKTDLEDLLAGRRDRVRSVAYTERDGMPHREANGGQQACGLRLRDGRLVFPTQAGLVGVDPARVDRAPRPPAVHVEAVQVGGRALVPSDGLVLAAGVRDVAIDYTAIAFDDARGLRLRHRLWGHDADWVEGGEQRRATYTRLPPGRHRFEVVAVAADPAASEAHATLNFEVPHRFFETWWFRGLLLLGGCAGVVLAFRVRTARVRAQARRLAAVVAEKTAELAAEKARAVEAGEEIARQAEALRELDVVKSRFFAHIHHELQTPLTLIAGPLDELLRAGAPPAMRPALEVMQRNTTRLRRLTGQMLELERASAGRLRAEPRAFDLTALAARTLDAFRGAADRRHLTLEADTPVGALADPGLTETVLVNLVSNAVKFTPVDGRVTVRVSAGDGRAQVEVEDDGVGIAEVDLPRIFDRFYRVESPGLRAREGTGLGLSLVRELVSLQGGQVRVESRPGVGSRFVVTLPGAAIPAGASALGGDRARRDASLLVEPTDGAADAERGEGARREATPWAEPSEGTADPESVALGESGDERPSVLVVDDNADLRHWVGEVLAPTYAVRRAPDGASALAEARRSPPDVVVADVMMPGLDGFALSRALDADPETRGVPVVLLTARGGADAEVQGLKSGAVDFLTKPFDAEVLRARVEAVIRRRERLREWLRAQAAEAVPARPAEAPTESGRDAGVDLPGTGADSLSAVAGSAELSAGPVGPDAGAAAALPSLAERARALIQARVDDAALDVSELARALGMSRATLARRLDAEGSPPAGELIRAVRLERARELLLAGAGNVSEVAFAVGFASLAQFSRAFKHAFGAPPSTLLPRS